MKTMSIYNNETIKICVYLNRAAPSKQEVNSQNYKLIEISQAEAYFLDQIPKREKLDEKTSSCYLKWS